MSLVIASYMYAIYVESYYQLSQQVQSPCMSM